jgi:hypothetical protein
VVDGSLSAGLAKRPVSLIEPIRLRLCGGRELLLPVSMTDERVATLVHLIEGRL